MDNPHQLIPIGHIGRPHGIKGELNTYSTVEKEYLFELSQGEAPLFLFLSIDGLAVPFRVEYLRDKDKESFIAKFTRINSKSEAESLTNATISIEESLLSEEASFSMLFFIGFTVTDEREHIVGVVTGVDDTTSNILFTIRNEEGKEYLISVADELITYVDAASKKIGITIPEGLIDL